MLGMSKAPLSLRLLEVKSGEEMRKNVNIPLKGGKNKTTPSVFALPHPA